MTQPLNVKFVYALWGTVSRYQQMLRNYVPNPDSYPWMTGEPPELFRWTLLTPLAYEAVMDKIIAEQQQRRRKGELDFLMYDSGGFQTLRKNYTIEDIIRKDYELYTGYPYADGYVLPDLPTGPRKPLEEMELNIVRSIKASFDLFHMLPDELKAKSIPVYHARKIEHIDWQYEKFQHITKHSKMASYSIAGLNKKFNAKHMGFIRYLKSLQPDCHIHLLGVGTPPAIFCMEQVGVNTFDAMTPHRIATLGKVATFYGALAYSSNLEESVEEVAIEEMREQTGHRCPFCDDLKRLKMEPRYRIMHNWIVYEELRHYYGQFDLESFQSYAPKWYKQLDITFHPEKHKKVEFEQPSLF